MKKLLLDALGEINDRHIEEAATYKTEAKSINLKKFFLPIAACFVILIVGALTVQFYPSPDVPITNSTVGTTQTAGTPPISDASTTVAYAPPQNTITKSTTSADITKTPEIRLFCTAPMIDYTGWESIPFQDFYHCINIGDAYYYADYVNNSSASQVDEPLPKENLGKLLYEFNRSDYRFEVDGSADFIVEIYELNGYSKEDAVAVGRKDGLMKGYYAYYRSTNEE